MRRFISFLLVIISASIPLAAQIDRTEVNGTVVDPSGSTIADAQVQLMQDDTGAVRQVTTNDVVVGFAMGGVPALTFVTVSEFEASKSGRDNSERLNDMQEKYHVFPGLQWEMDTESPQQILTTWMDSLLGRKSALFFDTGTYGNGVRETATILQAYVQNCEQHPSVA
jgi:hypothetical protein